MKKFLAILVAALMTVMILPLTACIKPDDDSNTVEYTVIVKSYGGANLKNVTVGLFDGANEKANGQTDTKGEVKLKAAPKEYEVRVSNLPHGYEAPKETYKTDTTGEKTTNIFLNSSVITDQKMPTGYLYNIGDVMYDFTVETSTGTTFNLADALKEEKKAVLINFWANWCGPCKAEMPAMSEAYEDYKDKLTIIALTADTGMLRLGSEPGYDTNEGIERFKTENPNLGVNFDMAIDSNGKLLESFNLHGIPTSIMVDRFGVYAWGETRGITSVEEWRLYFEHYTSDNYSQAFGGEDDKPTTVIKPKPDVKPQESALLEAAVNRNGFNGTYRPETEMSDWEYSWPWLVGEENGRQFIYASNKGKQENSFATVYIDFSVKKGQVVAFDYFLSTEPGSAIGGDTLYIILDSNYNDMVELSGVSEGWETHYLFAAIEDGEHTLILLYDTDDGNKPGDPYTDDVRISNIRYMTNQEVIDAKDSFDTRYYCSTNWDEENSKWQNYVDVGFNENDGYYHLLDNNGKPNGPYVFAEMQNQNTHWSNASISYYVANNYCIYDDGIDDTDLITKYCGLSTKSTVFGFVPVTQELYEALNRLVKHQGGGANHVWNEKEWLEMCSYYIHYGAGTGPADKDPLKGAAPFSAYDLHETKGTNDLNEIVIDRLTMPRGIYYKFVPETTAVYEFKSYADIKDDSYAPICWIEDEKGNQLSDEIFDTTNFTLYVELTAGKPYFARCDMYFQVTGNTYTWQLGITNVGSTYTHLRTVTYDFITYDEEYADKYGEYKNHIIYNGNIEAGQDINGNWVVRNKKTGDKLGDMYVDFLHPTYGIKVAYSNIHAENPKDIERNQFVTVKDILEQEGKPESQNTLYYHAADKYGSFMYDENDKAIYRPFTFDLTEFGYGNYVDIMKKYLEEAKANNGLVKVDATLGQILDEFTKVFSDSREVASQGTFLKDEWIMMCSYYHVYKV